MIIFNRLCVFVWIFEGFVQIMSYEIGRGDPKHLVNIAVSIVSLQFFCFTVADGRLSIDTDREIP